MGLVDWASCLSAADDLGRGADAAEGEAVFVGAAAVPPPAEAAAVESESEDEASAQVVAEARDPEANAPEPKSVVPDASEIAAQTAREKAEIKAIADAEREKALRARLERINRKKAKTPALGPATEAAITRPGLAFFSGVTMTVREARALHKGNKGNHF